LKPDQASATAKVIAAATLLLASDPATAQAVAPGAASLCGHFLATSWADRLLARTATRPTTRWCWRVLERLTHPGIIAHYWRRKRWIEAHCVKAMEQGVARVIVIGAGLDTLALRLATEWPEVEWIELDHPATQRLKQRGLSQAGVVIPSNLTLQALDLSAAPLPVALMNDERPTLVVLEAVLMYLSEANVVHLLRDQLAQLSTAPLRLIFSFMVRWPDGTVGFRPASKWVNFWLAWRSERFKWALEPAQLTAWLAQHGFVVLAQAEPPFLDTQRPTSESRLQGENLVLCSSGYAGVSLLAGGEK